MSSLACAGTVDSLQVSYQKGRYSIQLSATVDAGTTEVFHVITDYDQLHRLSDSFVESRLLDAVNDEKKRSLLVTNTCILFYCFRSRMVEDITEHPDHEVISTVDVKESDYRFGRNHWILTPLSGNRTRLQFSCEKEPAFWIPPVIGPWLLKHRMRAEALETMRRIETLARDV
ncbi:MAG: SRPBCC family protein [Gammaproteobacteria bacterium]|nr:SRPBCC family protein [Gammaproteobacteria bacterium]